uniref:ABC transporter domain-containing protein n=1 Tax=Trichogramma kaykai TaxID=54128 RepID=A0ABD2X1B1_9HYME
MTRRQMISETLRTFKLLLAKNLLLRQRHWKTNFIGEICVPILLVLGLWMARHLAGNLTSRAPVNMNNNTLYEGLTKDQLVDIGIGSDHLHIYFTPDNSFTRSLINKVATDCLRLNLHNITLHGYEIEKELEFAFAEIESRKSRKVVGVVFHNDQHDPSFSYKIRTRHFNEYERFNILSLKNMSEYYSITNLFVQMQLCIDEEFINKKTNDTTFRTQKINVLNGISMDFYETQITSILSRKGSGKSTFLSIIAGLVDPSDGSVNVDREKVDQKNFFIGFCMESKIFFPDLTIFEQFKFLAKLRMKNEDRNKVKDHIIELLMKIKLHDKKDNLAKTLREDEKKRLCIGMALVGNPKILILDEPTSGLDLEDKHLIWDILLKTRHEKTIILSTNDIEEADVLSDRIAILHSGLLMSYGTSDFLKKILGEGTIEIILNVDNSFNFESILTELNGETNIVNRLGNKVIIKVHEFPELPKFLDRLEMRKSEYGIKNFTVFNFNLERAYLSAIQVDEDPKISYETLSYSEKSVPKALLSITFVLKETSVTKPSLEIIPFHLGLYQSPETCYTSNNEIFGAKYKLVTEAQNGIAVKISNPNFSNG